MSPFRIVNATKALTINDKVLLRCCRFFFAHDDNLDRIAFHLIGKETRFKKKDGKKEPDEKYEVVDMHTRTMCLK